MCSCDFTDVSAAPLGLCIHIRQITPVHVTYITCIIIKKLSTYYIHLRIYYIQVNTSGKHSCMCKKPVCSVCSNSLSSDPNFGLEFATTKIAYYLE